MDFIFKLIIKKTQNSRQTYDSYRKFSTPFQMLKISKYFFKHQLIKSDHHSISIIYSDYYCYSTCFKSYSPFTSIWQVHSMCKKKRLNVLMDNKELMLLMLECPIDAIRNTVEVLFHPGGTALSKNKIIVCNLIEKMLQ